MSYVGDSGFSHCPADRVEKLENVFLVILLNLKLT